MACGAAPSTTGGGQERKTGEKRERARARRDRHDFSGALPSPAGRFSSSSSRDARDRRRSTCCATSWSVPAERHFLRVAGGVSERPCSMVFVSSSVGSGICGRVAARAARRGCRGCQPLSSRRWAWDHHARRGVAALTKMAEDVDVWHDWPGTTFAGPACVEVQGKGGSQTVSNLAFPRMNTSATPAFEGWGDP